MELLSFGKEELGRREFFDRLHESLTVGATPGRVLGSGRHFDGRSLVEPCTAKRQNPAAHPIREPTEVADTWKTSRQNMLHEAAQELFRCKCHRSLFAAVSEIG
jgi:hypothetical protein